MGGNGTYMEEVALQATCDVLHVTIEACAWSLPTDARETLQGKPLDEGAVRPHPPRLLIGQIAHFVLDVGVTPELVAAAGQITAAAAEATEATPATPARMADQA